MSRKVSFAVLLIIFGVAVGIALYVTSSGTSSAPVSAVPPTMPELPPPRPVQSAQAKIAVEKAIKQNRRLSNLNTNDAERLSTLASDLMQLYDGGSVDDFVSWVDAQGLPKSLWMVQHEGDEVSEWARSQAMTATGQYDLNGIKIFARVVDGKKVEKLTDYNGYIMDLRVPPNREVRPGELDISDPSTDVIEVVVPVVLLAKDGVPFKAKLGLMFGRNDKMRNWVIVAGTVYDTPVGKPLPPLRL